MGEGFLFGFLVVIALHLPLPYARRTSRHAVRSIISVEGFVLVIKSGDGSRLLLYKGRILVRPSVPVLAGDKLVDPTFEYLKARLIVKRLHRLRQMPVVAEIMFDNFALRLFGVFGYVLV